MAAMTESTTLFHVSDIHFGVEDPRAHDWFAAAVAQERPDAVICTGDLTQRAKHSEYAAAARWLRDLGVPIFVEPGNHDMPYYNLAERFLTPFRRFEALAASVHCDLHMPQLIVIALRTTVRAQRRFPWSDGVITRRALDACLTELERHQGDHRLKIIACHHPLVSSQPGRPNPTIGGDEALLALAKAGADVVLSGHVHDAFDIARVVEGRSVRLIGTGTLSRRLRGTQPTYTKLELTARNGLIVQHRVIDAAAAI